MCLILNQIIEIDKMSVQNNDKYILDTNVLIKLFYPPMNDHNVKPYIEIYQKIIDNRADIYISSIQISEFVNRCIRFQFKLYQEDHPEITDFKAGYRDTEDYRNSMDAILENVADMFERFKRIDDKFDETNSQNLLLKGFAYDFNDALIAELCRKYKAYLVTDDKDYINYLKGIDLVTANRKILMFAHKR